MTQKTGVWLIGALGGLATTVIAGCRILARGLGPVTGLASEQFPELGLVELGNLVFGGHEIRRGSLLESARQIARENGSIPRDALEAVGEDLRHVDGALRSGNLTGSGAAIEGLADLENVASGGDLRQQIERIKADLQGFRERENLERLVVVNLASTEPPLPPGEEHQTLAALERALDGNRPQAVRASLLYSYAALSLGHPYINFTPSNAALAPALTELAAETGTPFMGSDGKTGETLVKSALAPMFRHRALRVLSWEGYNMLGDRDGEVLSTKENLQSKVTSKDRVLRGILGYSLHTRVGIDYVPSLRDLKTAWDFIHFEGFLGHKMCMQFTWQGCDSVLAAPLVLDLVRFAELAARRGESGPMKHLACFFKSPHGVEEHDLHRQWQQLLAYVAGIRT